MYKNNNIEIWLSISQSLFQDLKPEDAGSEIVGCGMAPDEFAALVDREAERVNEAFLTMSLAKDKFEVRSIFKALSPDTVIVVCSRWAHCYGKWTQMLTDPNPPLRIPHCDMWRAIFLELSGNQSASLKEATPIKGEGF